MSESLLVRPEPAKAGVPLRPSNFFAHHDAHPIVLDALLVSAFGKEWWGWDPETLWDSIRDHFGPRLTRGTSASLDISALTHNKVGAVRVLHGTESFWMEWGVFAVTIQALCNNIPRFDVLQEPSVAQLMAGVDISANVSGREFSEEVARFVAASCLSEGVWYLPSPLDFAQVYASRPMYICGDCGDVGEDDLNDGVCDVCAGRFRGPKNLDWKPATDSAFVIRGEGKELCRFLVNDPAPVQKRYEEVVGTPSDEVDLKEEQVDVCVAKLLVARDYMNLLRKRMIDQMKVMSTWVMAH